MTTEESTTHVLTLAEAIVAGARHQAFATIYVYIRTLYDGQHWSDQQVHKYAYDETAKIEAAIWEGGAK